jgi:hypothetical protein
MLSIIIQIGCVCKIVKKKKSATIIKNKKSEYTKKDFLEIYQENKIDESTIKLYKSVQENNTDFYTGKIKYDGVTLCPDFNSDKKIKCGQGLHLSPTSEMALKYNQGKILECAVKISDFVIFSEDITKVRCKKVTVLK